MMVRVAGAMSAFQTIKTSIKRMLILLIVAVIFIAIFFTSCTARVNTNEYGVMQQKFGFNVGIVDKIYDPGIYLVGPGTTIHTFPREIHVLEAANDRVESKQKAARSGISGGEVDEYYNERDKLLGGGTH